jgi:hypothetical protein
VTAGSRNAANPGPQAEIFYGGFSMPKQLILKSVLAMLKHSHSGFPLNESYFSATFHSG